MSVAVCHGCGVGFVHRRGKTLHAGPGADFCGPCSQRVWKACDENLAVQRANRVRAGQRAALAQGHVPSRVLDQFNLGTDRDAHADSVED